VTWAWWAVAACAVAALGWHELTEHHLISRLFRREVDASPHHHMWDSIGGPQRRAIRAEMILFAALAAALAGIFPVPAVVVACLLTVASAGWVMFGRHPA
jgi:hypothetical protein